MKPALVILLALTLIGCQTTPSYDLSEMDASVLSRLETIPAERCTKVSINKTTGEKLSGSNSIGGKFVIKNFRKNTAGWYAAYGVVNGIWDTVYYNPSNNQVHCGKANWEQVRPTGYEGSFSEFPKINSSQVVNSTRPLQARNTNPARNFEGGADIRSVAVNWEGVSDLLAGTLRMNQNSRSGSIEITLPSGLGTCRGNFSAQNASSGTWNVQCPNSSNASGTYVAFGDGRGSKGVGFDDSGRRVSYTIGSRQVTTPPQLPKVNKCERLTATTFESMNEKAIEVALNMFHNDGIYNQDDMTDYTKKYEGDVVYLLRAFSKHKDEASKLVLSCNK